tara:strand:- start:3484 stop:5013 length:1530 start_codon:yes stop_codon:yes gene_type:complete
LENFAAGLDLLFSGNTFFFLLGGVVLGFVVGVLPGFSATNAVAIVLPFSIGLGLTDALLMMVGIYAGATFAGAIPAILLNVPGTPGAAATAIEGHPMALKGQANRAIGIARMASTLGGTLAMCIILPFLPLTTGFALSFGSRELLLVAVFGLLMITTVIGDDVRKGMIAGLLGLAIAMMGSSPITAAPRATFGLIELADGVPFIPALIGLFAFGEMFLLGARGQTVTSEVRAERDNNWLREAWGGIVATLSYPVTIIRSSLIGLGVGMVPGTGTAVGNFISYGLARRFSRNPELNGKGNPEGIVASEAADNAVAAGTLVPTMTLGIPGSGTAAVMLAAMLLHGVTPGPRVMITHTAEVYATFLGLLFATLLILPLGLILARPMLLVCRLPAQVLAPGILVVGSVGAFAFRNSLFDVGLAMAFGVLGMILRAYRYPIAPLILALIIGPIAEMHLMRSLRLSRGQLSYYFDSPVALVLWALLAFMIVYAILLERRRLKAASAVATFDGADA